MANNDLRQALLKAAVYAAKHSAANRANVFIGFLIGTIGDDDIALNSALADAIIAGNSNTASALLTQAH